MNRGAIAWVALALLLAPSFGAAKPPEPRDLDDAVVKSMKAWSVPGAAVVVVRDGKVAYLKGHGVREAGKEGGVTPDTLFCLGSSSKAFTTAALARLVEEKKLGWDDRVRDHLATFRLSDDLASRDVRLRDLLCHRTGLATNDLLWYRAPWSPEESVERLAHLPLAKPFRTAFQYNSTTYTAAGLAAAKAAGTSWEALIQKRLLDPLAMKRTRLDAAAADKDPDRARPHRLDDAGEAKPFLALNMRKPDAAGSVHSCARDLAAWLSFHLGEGKARGKQVVSARALAETYEPQVVLPRTATDRATFPDTVQSSYALGWVILDHRGHRLVAHGGALDGQRAQIVLVPAKKLGVAVLSNLHQTPMNLALSFTLLELILDLPGKRDWDAIHQEVRKQRLADARKKQRDRLAARKPDAKPSRELIAYAGTYEHKAFGRVRIQLLRGKLVWEYRGEKAPLEHFHHDTFAVTDELPGVADVAFRFGDKGAVSGFEAGGNFNVTFRRVER